MVKISIIIPIFNAGKYLVPCLDSILAQTAEDFEVVLVNDGSKDNSIDICKEYESHDNRIRLFNKKNGGVSSARNVGLAHAKGKYVIFVDSDDRLPEDALQNHLKHFSEEVDMTMGSFLAFSDEEPEAYRVEVGKSEIVSRDKCLYDFTLNDKVDWQRYLWNRMLRRSVIERYHLRFNEKIHYKEDGLFLVQYLLRCEGKVAYIPELVYCYRLNPASAMGALSAGQTDRLATNIDAHAQIIQEMRNARVNNLILSREISHAFQSRNWVLDIIKKSGSGTLYVGFSSLLKLYCAVGPKMAMKAIGEAVNRRIFSLKKQ